MAITKLYAGTIGDPLNSTGAQVASSVNQLIDSADQHTVLLGTLDTSKAAVGHGHSLATSSTPGFLSASDKQKLDSIIFGATQNSADSFLLSRVNHTGTQPISTISGLQAELNTKASESHNHLLATSVASGFLSNTDKIKLDTVQMNATFNSADSYLLNRANHTGTQSTSTITNLDVILAQKADGSHAHAVATGSSNGFMSIADKIKLDTVFTGATVNSSDATLLDRANHTGAQPISSIELLADTLAGKAGINHLHAVATVTSDGFLSSADKIKLDSIATGATANSSDAELLKRINHTGTQPMSTIVGLLPALSYKQEKLVAGPGITIDTSTWTISSTGSGTGGTDDHSALLNRNAPDQHVIASVSGLRGELDAKAGISHTHSEATTSVSGFMSSADKTKLDLIAANATSNSSDATLLNRANHTGTQAISTVELLQASLDGKASASHTHGEATTSVPGFMSSADKTKLDSVATNATSNSSDTTLLSRANHTGTQAISTIASLQASLDNLQSQISTNKVLALIGMTR